MPPKKSVPSLPGPQFPDVPDAGRYASGADDRRDGYKIAITKDAWPYFDYLTNCILRPRKSDQGFLDPTQFMLSPRPGTRTYGNVVSGSGRTNDLIFYTSAYDRTRTAYMTTGGKVYKNVAGTWTDVGIPSLTGQDVRFNVMRLPYSSGAAPAEYTSQASTAALFVKPDVTDTVGSGNVGKYILVTSNTSSSSAPAKYFRWFVSQITSFDATNGYYCPYFSARQTAPAGLKYQVFDALYDVLQVTTGQDLDYYYDGHSVLSGYTGAASYQLGLAVGAQYCGRCVNYAGHTFTAKDSFVIGAPWTNPFNFEISNQYNTGNGGQVIELFVFKQYLIVGAVDYVGYLQPTSSGSQPFELTAISKKFGVKQGGIADMGGSELYYIASNSELYSLQQSFNSLNQSYTYLMLPTNIGNAQQNFLNGYVANVCAGFDGRRMYLYGEADGTSAGVTLVYDLNTKWWFDWTSLRPVRIVSEGGVTYFAEGGRGAVSYFDTSIFQDRYDGATGDLIMQRCRTKNNFLGDIFRIKGVQDVSFWLDDYDQRFTANIYASTIRSSGTLNSKDFEILASGIPDPESSASGPGTPYGADMFGTDTFGTDTGIPGEAFPNLWRIQMQNQNSFNTFRVELVGIAGFPFYLNEIAFRASLDESPDTFPPTFVK